MLRSLAHSEWKVHMCPHRRWIGIHPELSRWIVVHTFQWPFPCSIREECQFVPSVDGPWVPFLDWLLSRSLFGEFRFFWIFSVPRPTTRLFQWTLKHVVICWTGKKKTKKKHQLNFHFVCWPSFIHCPYSAPRTIFEILIFRSFPSHFNSFFVIYRARTRDCSGRVPVIWSSASARASTLTCQVRAQERATSILRNTFSFFARKHLLCTNFDKKKLLP